MKSVKTIVILLALVIIPAVGIYLWSQQSSGQGPSGGGTDTPPITPHKVTATEKGMRVMRASVKGGVTEKLKKGEPQKLSLVVQTSGRASDANWGLKGSGSFVLNTLVECESEIIEKKETVKGNIKVVEKRTFTLAKQSLSVFDTDVSLALYETLPMKEALQCAKSIGAVLGCIPPSAGAGASTIGISKAVEVASQKYDGKSAKDLLSYFGVNVPKKFKDKINDFIAKEDKTDKLMRTEDIEGKTYRITYIQSAEGRPMCVDIKRFNDNETMSEQEKLLLRRANALLDWQILKGESYEVGREWKVDSSDFECLFDPYVEGSYSGEVVVRREANDADGDWTLKVKPGFVSIVSDKGKTTGKVRIDDGSAKIDEPNCRVKSMQIVGKAGARNLSEHHLLFTSHVEGECSFRAILTSAPREK